MNRTREPRILRRRHRTTGLRDSSEEGQVEVQETVRLRAAATKRDRDRNSFSKSKRKRGPHREESERSAEESVGNEQDYDLEDGGFSRMLSPNISSSASDHNQQRSFHPAKPVRLTPPPWSITDEVIGVTVPKKARSAFAKRSHDSCISASYGGGEQNFRRRSNSPDRNSVEAASPSSSNFSVQKKKAISLSTRLPKTSKSSSTTEEDIEIEIAELLYGLKTSRNQDSSEKLETNGARAPSGGSKTSILCQNTNPQTSVLPRASSPSSYPSTDVERKKAGDDEPFTPAPKGSTAEAVKSEREQPAKVETFSPESVKSSRLNDDDPTGRDTKSSISKEEIKRDNLESNAGFGVISDGKSVSLAKELPSCCRLDVVKEGSADTRGISAIPGGNNQRVEKFLIDLMAPPPMVLSPKKYDLSRGNFTSEGRALAFDVELKTGNNINIEDKEERLAKNEEAPEEIKETKMDTFEEKQDVLKIDLEMPNKENDSLTRDNLEEQDKKRELPPKMTDHEGKKTAHSTLVSLSTFGPAWSSNLPPPVGYVPPPLQPIVKTDKTTVSSTALQMKPVNFVLSPPQPKHCATHHYIARNIFLHQQFLRMNHIWPRAISSGSLCGAKPNNVNAVPTSESMIFGQRSQKKLPGVNENMAQVKKELAASNSSCLTANKTSGATNSVDSMQMKQQGPHPALVGNLMHQPSLATAATSHAGGVNSSCASCSDKSISSAAGSLGNSSSLPAVAPVMSFSYPNLAANDVPYMTIVQNNGYPFSFSTPQGATASIRCAAPAPAAHMMNGPFYSSQMFHPFQRPQQLPPSQALVQPSYPNSSTSLGSSSSHKQPYGAQVNANNILSSTSMQLQQSQKQSTPQSLPHKLEAERCGEEASSVGSQKSYCQKNAYGQNFTIPVQPVNFSFRPSTTLDSGGGKNGNFGDKQQKALKGGVELVPSQAFAISFAAYNGTSVPSNLSFSSMAQSPMIFQSLPSVAWQGYHSSGTAQSTQQKGYSMSEGKSGGNSTRQDDEKKVNSGKSSTNGPTTLGFDNSSKNLSFVLSPTNGSWPGHSVASTVMITNASLPSNASSSQHLLQLHKQHNVQQQQSPVATRYKATTSTTSATKIVNNPPVFTQNFTQCNSSNPASHLKSSGRTSDSQIFHTSVLTATASNPKNVSQELGRVLQDQAQISFGGNYKSFPPPQGRQLLNNNQPSNIIFAGSPPNGSNLKTNSQGNQVSSSVNALQTQEAENSSAGAGKKSSPVCARNVPSILTLGPNHLSEVKY